MGLWKKETKNIKIKNFDKLFLVVYPDDLVWDFSIEKQTQTTTLMVSGGSTGAGTGHDVQFCYQSQLRDVLKKSHHSHAMIVSVGMVFDMTPSMTSIDEFLHFTKSDLFCKAHIIAKPHEPAYLHHQHIDLNVDMWNNIGSPDIFSKRIWRNYDRADFNFHDDYTPLHLTPAGLPQIDNFSETERSKKAYSYPNQRDYNAVWKDLDNVWKYVDKADFYFSRFMTRIQKSFYILNNETFIFAPDENFDLIFSPTAGYSGEKNCRKLGIDDVVFYDYTQANIDLKKKIVEMNMSLEELNILKEMSDEILVNNIDNSPSADRSVKMGPFDELRKMQAEMFEQCDIEYWLMDLINPDYNKLSEKVKDKIVLFDASNIFSYHISHAYYTLDELINSFNKLQKTLIDSTKMCWFQGTRPTKQWDRKWIS